MKPKRRTSDPLPSEESRDQLGRELEEGFLGGARGTLSSIQSGLETLSPGHVDDFTARHLNRQFGGLRKEAVRLGFLDLGEIAMAAEAVFSAVVNQTGGFREDELSFLRNVATSVEEMLASIERRDVRPASMNLVGDGFDKLLMRLGGA